MGAYWRGVLISNFQKCLKQKDKNGNRQIILNTIRRHIIYILLSISQKSITFQSISPSSSSLSPESSSITCSELSSISDSSISNGNICILFTTLGAYQKGALISNISELCGCLLEGGGGGRLKEGGCLIEEIRYCNFILVLYEEKCN